MALPIYVPENSREEVFGLGVLYITCDVAERGALEIARERILQEVGFPFSLLVSLCDLRSHIILLLLRF